MTRFIKLTKILLNVNDITKILIDNKKYTLYIKGKEVDGFFLLLWGTGVNNVSSSKLTDIIEICSDKHAIDYQIIKDWINREI